MKRHASAVVLLAAISVGLLPQVDAQQPLRRLIEHSRAAEDTPLPAGTRVERDIAYGSHAKQRYDVYVPARPVPGAPILIMVHGGGWRIGDKNSPGVVGANAAHWLGKGFVFVTVNNRLLPDADPLEQARDVAAAVASAQNLALRWKADPRRVVLMGHSAGAHLVALLATSPGLLAQAGALRPLGVVALDGAALDVPGMMGKLRLPKPYVDAFGKDPAFWVEASPLHRLTRQGVPMLVVCSSRRLDPCPQARSLMDKARTLGVPVRVLPEDMTHAEINWDLGKPSAYTRDVAAWIDELLKAASG